jgi:hypothetical protein
MRVLLAVFGLVLLGLFSIGCSKSSIPLALNSTPTAFPTPVPLPTKIAVAAPTPTPTLVLLAPGDTSEAVTLLNDFIQAVVFGNLEGAMSFWNTSQPGQASGYDANVRKMVKGWIDKKSNLVIGNITYSGLDGTGKSVSMPIEDPRVEKATAKVYIDGVEYQFYMLLLKGGWFIEGVNTFAK